LGLALSIALPEAITHGMHVGAAFLASQSRANTLGRIRFKYGSRLSARMGDSQDADSVPVQDR
jgi:hypothetical protein